MAYCKSMCTFMQPGYFSLFYTFLFLGFKLTLKVEKYFKCFGLGNTSQKAEVLTEGCRLFIPTVCHIEERKLCRLETTWGWVNDEITFNLCKLKTINTFNIFDKKAWNIARIVWLRHYNKKIQINRIFSFVPGLKSLACVTTLAQY